MKGCKLLSLVIPKGSLERATLDLFDAADLTVRRSSERDYHASIDDPRIERVRFLRPQEIPSYVEQGLFDFGITGRDWITETGADVESLGELQYSKATADPVRVVLAVPATVPWQSAADLPEGIRISTEFPALTRRYLDARGVKAVVIPSYGATEAKVPDIVDAIVDLTETGASLVRNGLRILDTLLTSYTELIANPAAYADPAKREAMEDVLLLLRGAISARGNVLLKLNVERGRPRCGLRYPARYVVAHDHLTGPRRHARGRGGRAQARGEHAYPGAKGGWRARHPGDPDQQDRRLAECSGELIFAGGSLAGCPRLSWRAMLPRADLDVSAAVDQVRPLCEDVQARGGAAVREYTARFDGVELASTAVPQQALSAALAGLDPDVRAALTEAARRARLVHEAQRPAETWTAVAAGSTVTERYLPVRRAGVYVPGGLVAYPSSVLMNVIPAQVAGVAEIAVASPPQPESRRAAAPGDPRGLRTVRHHRGACRRGSAGHRHARLWHGGLRAGRCHLRSRQRVCRGSEASAARTGRGGRRGGPDRDRHRRRRRRRRQLHRRRPRRAGRARPAGRLPADLDQRSAR